MTPYSTNANRSAPNELTAAPKIGILTSTHLNEAPHLHSPPLIDTLDAGGAKATFFVTGTLYGCIHDRAEFIKKAVKSRHQIGPHTKLEGALATILGGKKPTYMRVPYLSVNDMVTNVMKKMGYRIILCDMDSQDWNGLTPEQSMERIRAAGASGNEHISLMHETVKTTPVELAPSVIAWAKENGLEMVTVAECLGDNRPYCAGG
ncbi:chitin deacetylase [Tirmania nivea]|nr:chitin deacetylase [Tirmania nivea]